MHKVDACTQMTSGRIGRKMEQDFLSSSLNNLNPIESEVTLTRKLKNAASGRTGTETSISQTFASARAKAKKAVKRLLSADSARDAGLLALKSLVQLY
jgi:hypothetical protein